MTNKTDSNVFAHLAGEFVEAAAATQAVGLAILQAEMEALTHVLPGTSNPRSEAERAREEAQIEADFDNMPV